MTSQKPVGDPSGTRPSLLDRLKGFQVPHPLLILVVIVILAALATYLIPGGEYLRQELDGRMIVVPGSYRGIASHPRGILDLLVSPFAGMLQAAEIIMLVFIIGGAFGLIKDTGALNAGIAKMTHLLRGREIIIIPVLMILFGLAGGTFGMYEEVLPFVALVVPMTVAMGYDSIVGVAIVYLGTVLGFCGAFFNPFTVGIAQGIAGLPLFSGIGYRLVVWAAMVGTGIIYVLIYAIRVKRNPTLSETCEHDKAIREKYAGGAGGSSPLSRRHLVILILIAIGFGVLPYGVIAHSWGMKELTGLFVALAVAAALVSDRKINKLTEAFVAGAGELVGAALLIGVARGVKIMLDDGLVMDTILFYLSSGISYFPRIVAVEIMFLVQCCLNLVIQSGSAQAAVSMPIMAPLSDILGITRQTAVLAFQLGDGFTNFAIPWNGITLAVLNIGLVPIWAWFKWAWKLQAWLILVCMALLIWPTLAGWGPF